MTWLDRLQQAAYTSPSGVRITFDYEDVSRNFDKKTTAFDFPDADGTYVQDLGATGYRYPFRLFIWGDNYDQTATQFEDALREKGVGKLEHPLYGTIDVVPFGQVSRIDNLKTAANQAVFELVFFDTTGLVYPTTQNDPASQVMTGISGFNDATAEQLAEKVDLDTTVERVTFQARYEAMLDRVSSALGDIAATQQDVQQRFTTIRSSIDRGIDILINDPVTLAYQTVLLVQEPARAASSINARLDAYRNLIDIILNGNKPTTANEFYNNDLFVSAYVSGAVNSVLNTTFDTKPEALTAAEFLLDQFERVNDWRDENIVDLDLVDTGASYQALQEAAALAAGFLVEISFTLRQERRIVLDRARTLIDLSAELYGSVDDQLDFLINSNELTGDEIKELPRGREIVYYI